MAPPLSVDSDGFARRKSVGGGYKDSGGGGGFNLHPSPFRRHPLHNKTGLVFIAGGFHSISLTTMSQLLPCTFEAFDASDAENPQPPPFQTAEVPGGAKTASCPGSNAGGAMGSLSTQSPLQILQKYKADMGLFLLGGGGGLVFR